MVDEIKNKVMFVLHHEQQSRLGSISYVGATFNVLRSNTNNNESTLVVYDILPAWGRVMSKKQ
jgi:hypothetical protein